MSTGTGSKADLRHVLISLARIANNVIDAGLRPPGDEDSLLHPPHGEPCIALCNGLSAIRLCRTVTGIPGADALFIDSEGDLLLTNEEHLPLIGFANLREPVLDLGREAAIWLLKRQALARLQTVLGAESPLTPTAQRLLDACYASCRGNPCDYARDRYICDQLGSALEQAWSDTLAQPTFRTSGEAEGYLYGASLRVHRVTIPGTETDVASYLWRRDGRVIARGFRRNDQFEIVQIGRSLFHLRDLKSVREWDLSTARDNGQFNLCNYLNILNCATSYGECRLDDPRYGGPRLNFAWYNDMEMIASGWINFKTRRGEIAMPSTFTVTRTSSETETNGTAKKPPFQIIKDSEALAIWRVRCATVPHRKYTAVDPTNPEKDR